MVSSSRRTPNACQARSVRPGPAKQPFYFGVPVSTRSTPHPWLALREYAKVQDKHFAPFIEDHSSVVLSRGQREFSETTPSPPTPSLSSNQQFTMARMPSFSRYVAVISLCCVALLGSFPSPCTAFVVHPKTPSSSTSFRLLASSDTKAEPAAASAKKEEEPFDYDVPEDVVVIIKPKAMKRLRELRAQQKQESLILRMGVRNGGCSGLSYVMDFSTEDSIQDDDAIDHYSTEHVKCVIDAKSMLYLYGLELDYSEELIGGGFKFFNPNAEDSCGCGSSFNV
jgi:iron-sulfur cluster assembly 1